VFDQIGAEGCESIAKTLESNTVSILVTSFVGTTGLGRVQRGR